MTEDRLSRRSWITRVAGCGAAFCLGSLASCTRRPSTIRMYASGGFDIGEAAWQKVCGGLGVSLSFKDNGNDTGPIIAQMTGGSASLDYDLAGIQGGVETVLAKAGVVSPWDLSLIPNFQETWSWVRDIKYTSVDGKRFGIPIGVNADSIIYLPDKLKTVRGYESGTVDSYAAVFDERLKGKTSMEDAWINSAIFTAIYLKESRQIAIDDPGNLTESELEGVMKFLIEKKRQGQFRKFWNGWEQGVELVRSGEVWAMTGWEPIVKELQRRGINALYAEPKEGYEGWTQDLLLLSGARTRSVERLVHQFVNSLLDGRYGCFLASLRGYVVPNDRAPRFAKNTSEFDERQISATVHYVQKKLSGKIYWQNVRPDNHALYEEWWSRLRSA
jgi:putative spermidine/putrescine transport system substrate-binding protein